jgi:hypothetical protein
VARAIPLKHAVRFWAATLGSVAFLYYGGELGNFLIASDGIAARWAGVIVAALAPLPWIIIAGMTLMMVDEYYRRLALVGTATAFVLDIAFHIAFHAALDAHLVARGFDIPDLVMAGAAWMIGMGAASVYYRYRL